MRPLIPPTRAAAFICFCAINGTSANKIAKSLNVSRQCLSAVINGRSRNARLEFALKKICPEIITQFPFPRSRSDQILAQIKRTDRLERADLRRKNKLRDIDTNAIGYRIRTARKGKKMNQGALAKKCNISLIDMSLIERGKRPISNEILVLISNALETSPEQLIGKQKINADLDCSNS